MGFRKIHLQLSSWVKLELLGCVEIESVISYLINGIFMPCQSSKEPLKKATHSAWKSPKMSHFYIAKKKFKVSQKFKYFDAKSTGYEICENVSYK